MSNQGKYKSLVTNTALFALATFGSKLLVLFFMTPLYTRLLEPSEMGVIELITDSCNLLIPIMIISINEAVIRFGMDRAIRKQDVYTTGILIVGIGYGTMWLLSPALSLFALISPYKHLIYLYIIASALRSVTNHFVRALGHIRLFAADGVFTILTTIGFNLVFLLGFKMGVTGYILATVCADFLSAFLLTVIAKTYQYFDPWNLDLKTAKNMLLYSMPLVPASIFWWITNLSDRYLIAYFLDASFTGLYGTANKIPMIITLVSAVFIQAWQLSAFSEYGTEEGRLFYSDVFRSYYTLIFLAASGIILLVRPIMRIMVAPSYYECWQYAPVLVLGVAFSCLVTFLGTIYNAAKKNSMVTITTAIGAATNIVLNFLLIPLWGAQAAAITTCFSYILVFVIRAVDSRKYMKLDMKPLRIVLSLVLLLGQILLSLLQPPYGIAGQIVIFIGLLFVNRSQLLIIIEMLLKAVKMFLHSRQTES